jgi:hypothetical protein
MTVHIPAEIVLTDEGELFIDGVQVQCCVSGDPVQVTDFGGMKKLTITLLADEVKVAINERRYDIVRTTSYEPLPTI